MKSFMIATRVVACLVLALALFAAPSEAQVVINELHYHPEAPNGNAEFIELHNLGGAPVDISGWTLSGFAATPFVFPGSTSLAAGGYVVVAHDIALLDSVTGFLADHEWPSGNLSNGGETIVLSDNVAAEVDSVTYDDAAPWPSEADGDGRSLELVNPAFDNSSPNVWAASAVDNGTPGAQNGTFSENPLVLFETPARLSIASSLTQVSVIFAEAVSSVSAGDLTVNGSPATGVSGTGAGPYDFTGFAAPTTAPISIALAAGSIQDLDTNPFGGDAWVYPNVVINEIHYHPADPNNDAEFLELLNAGDIPADISGWQLDFGPVPFQFPATTTVPAGDVVVVAKDATLLETLTGFAAPHEWGGVGSLNNGGELITLSTGPSAEVDRVDYGDRNQPPWPAAPDGEGPSLELIHPSLDNTLPLAWNASVGANGTPGGVNSSFDAGPIVISEIPARGALISGGLIEVSITFHEAVTGVAAGDLVVDGAAATGLTGSGAGPYVFTIPAPSSDVVDVTFGPGAIQDLDTNPFSGDAWQYVLNLPSIVINELHYHPADSAVGVGEDPELLQFVELYNAGASPVDLTGWRMIDGITFEFPDGTSIADDDYVLIAKDAAFLLTTIPSIPGGTQVFTWDGGDLGNGGERVRLSDPFANTVDVVEYNDEGEWPEAADGTGPSLELINPLLLNQFALAWQVSAGTNGTPGEENSVFSLTAPPVIGLVNHAPAIPAGGAPVTITARVSDTSEIFFGGTVQVCHRQDQVPTIGYTCELMSDDGAHGDGAAFDGTFGATVTGLADGARLDFAIHATGGGGTTIAPRRHVDVPTPDPGCVLEPGVVDCAGINPPQVYLVEFSDDALPTDMPSYHLIVTQVTRNGQESHNKTEYDGTFIQCDTAGVCKIFYNVIERFRGQSSLNQHPHSFHIQFPNDPLPSEMGFDITNLLLMGQQPYRQALGYDLFEGAGHPTPKHQFVHLNTNPVSHGGFEDYVYINIERVDDEFMRSQGGAVTPARFPDRCTVANNVCVTDLDCPGGETCDPHDRGNVYRGRNDGDLRWEGPTVDPVECGGPYRLQCDDRNGYQKVTNGDIDDWTDLINLADALTCAVDSGSICTEATYDGVYESTLIDHMDVQPAAAWFGLQMVLNNNEGGIWRDTGDDYFIAVQPSFDHASFISWDNDAIFANAENGPTFGENIWRTRVDSMERFLQHNAFSGYFVGEICRLLNDGFSVAEMDAAIDAQPDILYSQPEPQGPQGGGPTTKAGLKTWVADRHTGILNEISTQTTLTGVPASPYTDPDPVIALSGALNQCGARRVLVNGLEADTYQIHSLGAGGADWSSNFTLVPGVNNIIVETVNHAGAVIDSAADVVIYSPPGSGGGPVSLKVTGPTRMVNTKTHTVRAEILDALGNTHWQTWTETGTVSARRVSDLSSVPITVTVFETFNGGEGAGGPAPGEIRLYNGLGSVSYSIDDPVSVAGQDLEITVTVGAFSDSTFVTALDETAPGLFKVLSGTLSGADLTWDPSDGVIHLDNDVTIPDGSTLTINPGTLIMADEGSPGDGVGVTANSNASVQAIGTEADPIFFFATLGPAAMVLRQGAGQQNQPLAWQGIEHTGSLTSNYAWVFLTGAGNGDVTGHPRPVVLGFLGSHGFNVTDCVFADNPGKVLHGGGSGTYVVSRSLFSRAGIGGEFFGANHDLLVEDSWFTRNGRAPEPNGVDGDALHVDNGSATQLLRRMIIADCGDDAIDHNGSFPVVEDSIIWDVRDKAASLTGGGITFDNVLVFNTGQGIRGGTGTVVVRNSTIAVNLSVDGSGPRTIDETIVTSNFNIGSCSGNINYTLGPNTNHIACGVGNLTGSPQFQDPGNCDYSLLGGSPAADAGPTGGRIGWLGFPEGVACVNDGECDDGNACTLDSCDAGACVFVPIDDCAPCVGDGECDDGNPCTLDTCSGGFCSNPAGNDGVTCDDGLACTDTDICGSGICAGTDNCPVGEVCDVMTGTCDVPAGLQPGDIIISGFSPSGSPEWVELFNTTNQAISLENLNIVSRTDVDPTPDGTLDIDWQLSDETPVLTGLSIEPYSFFLIGENGTTPAPDLESVLDFATGEGGANERAISLEATVEAVPVHMDYVLYGRHDGSDSAAIPPGDLFFDGVTFPRAEVVREKDAAATGFGEGLLQRVSQTALYSGYAIEGYYVDETALGDGFPDGVWSSSAQGETVVPRNSGDDPVLPPSPDCTDDVDCNDLQFCNGVETCNMGTFLCEPGTPPVCDDGIACTTDSCNETTDSCESGLCPMTVTAVGGRYLEITPPTGLAAVSLRVDSGSVSCLPQYVDENGLLVGAAVFRTSAEWGTIFVGDREILPSTVYDVSAEVTGPQVVGVGSASTWLWGDANNVDGAEVFDIACVQDGFAGSFTTCALEGDDIREGIPDRAVDLDDVMAVLDGVALLPYPDGDPCSGPPPAPAQWTGEAASGSSGGSKHLQQGGGDPEAETEDTRNLITLVPSAESIEPGQDVSVDVFVRETANLRGYQIGLEVVGEADGRMLTEQATINSNREDFAFTELTSYRVSDVDGLRLGAALGEGGVGFFEPRYLGTFVFKATETAEGVFVIRFVESKTYLRDDFSGPIEHQLGDDVEIQVVVPDNGSAGSGNHDRPMHDFSKQNGENHR